MGGAGSSNSHCPQEMSNESEIAFPPGSMCVPSEGTHTDLIAF